MLRIIKYPHPALRHKSKPLRHVDGDLKKAIREMFTDERNVKAAEAAYREMTA